MQLLGRPLQSRVSRASKKLGLSEREFITRAVAAYLQGVGMRTRLARELRAWDELSALTMRKHGF